MKYLYPAVFTQENGSYLVSVPDLPGCHTFAQSLPEAIEMARDAISMWLCEAENNKEQIPAASEITQLDVHGGFANLIDADTAEYRRLTDNRAVKKTLSVPSWLNAAAEKAGLNFSQVLQEGLREYLKI